ncbi:MAG: Hint domain-containing protein [Pseudomonadota bacterium]
MTWIALADADTNVFDPRGLDASPDAAALIDTCDQALLPRGTLVIECRVPVGNRPRSLITYTGTDPWPFHISLQVLPDAGLIFVLNQGDEIVHQTLRPKENGRLDILRVSFCWDAPARRACLALEQSDQDQVTVLALPAPKPIRVADVRALFGTGADRYVAPGVVLMAVSSKVEPLGPRPSLDPNIPIDTPQGRRPLSALRRGDLVITGNGAVVPVLEKLYCTVPARGTTAPLLVRAPYFGLRQDIKVAPTQRLILTGSDVEYLFGHEAVLASARSLTGGHSVLPAETGHTVRYAQLLLPGHEPVQAAGATVESLYIGRLRRKPAQLATSILSGLDRHMLPDHGHVTYPVLRHFDARVLAEQRAA